MSTFKSLNKVDSKGYYESLKMCLKDFEDNKCKMINRQKLGRTVSGVLEHARLENRLVCGLVSAVATLERNPEDVLVCVLPSAPGDAAAHMQQVLLQAYCYENYVPVIQVDSSEKLAEACGMARTRKKSLPCAVVTKFPQTPDGESPCSPTEQILKDFYKCTLEEHPRPIIELPG